MVRVLNFVAQWASLLVFVIAFILGLLTELLEPSRWIAQIELTLLVSILPLGAYHLTSIKNIFANVQKDLSMLYTNNHNLVQRSEIIGQRILRLNSVSQTRYQELQKNYTELIRRDDVAKRSIDNIQQGIDSWLEGQLLSYDQFYGHLAAAVIDPDTEKIYLTHFRPSMEDQLSTNWKTYKKTIKEVIRADKVQVHRIVSIFGSQQDIVEKLAWVKREMEKYKGIQHFSMKYIDLDILQNANIPMLTLLNLQIIFRKHGPSEVFVVNPPMGYFPSGPDNDLKGLWLKGTDIANFFSKSFEGYWRISTPLVDAGKPLQSNYSEIEDHVRWIK